jgi:hypothetical protein
MGGVGGEEPRVTVAFLNLEEGVRKWTVAWERFASIPKN